MAYTDIGFDEFLNRDDGSAQGSQMAQTLDPLQTDTFLQQLSGSKIQGGVLTSPDGRVKLDLNQGVFKVSNGVQDLVQLGVLSDGTIGLLIKDNNGNTIVQIAGGVNIIQSPSGLMTFDISNEIFKVLNDQNIPVVELGLLSS